MRLYHPNASGNPGAAAWRWGSAGLLVALLHAGAGWWIARHVVSAAPPDTVRGIPVDLEPVAVPMNAPTPNTTAAGGAAPTPQTAATPAEPQPAPEAPPAETPPPPDIAAPPPDATAAPPPPTTPTPTPTPMPSGPPPPAAEPPPPAPKPPPPEPVQPAAPSVVQPAPAPPPATLPQKPSQSDAVLAPAQPPRPPPPDPRVVAREAARRKAEADRRAQQRAARAEARAQAAAAARVRAAALREAGGPGPTEAAPSSASSGASVATWRGEVQARLRAFIPTGLGASGTARVAFAVDRSGRVVSASLASSSGDASLDSAAVAMVRRASPLPAPPQELGARVALSLPVRFQ